MPTFQRYWALTVMTIGLFISANAASAAPNFDKEISQISATIAKEQKKITGAQNSITHATKQIEDAQKSIANSEKNIAASEKKIQSLQNKLAQLKKDKRANLEIVKLSEEPFQLLNSTKLCMDDESGKMKKGSKMVVWKCNDEGPSQQRQTFTHQPSGQITNPAGLCLDLENGKEEAGEALILWTCNDKGEAMVRQRWTFMVSKKIGILKHVSGLCVDLTKKGAKGAQLVLEECNTKDQLQLWATRASMAGDAVKEEFTVTQIRETPAQLHMHYPKALCLDEDSGKMKKGGKVIAWHCSSSGQGMERQTFTHTPTGQIESANELCLDLKSGKAKPGERMTLWTCNKKGDPFERQRFTYVDGPYGGALKHSSGLCLEAKGNIRAGALIILNECKADNNNQVWYDAAYSQPKDMARPVDHGMMHCGIKVNAKDAISIINHVHCQVRYRQMEGRGYRSKYNKSSGEYYIQPEATGWLVSEEKSGKLLNTQSWSAQTVRPAGTKKTNHAGYMEIVWGDNEVMCSEQLEPDQTLVLEGISSDKHRQMIGKCRIATKRGNNWGW